MPDLSVYSLRVSIHAPRAGCDDDGTIIEQRKYGFQFTHPVRGATTTILHYI